MSELTARGREMLEIVRDQCSSGETVRGYARRIGMSPATLQWWRRQLREYVMPESSGSASFVEVTMDTDAATRRSSRFVVHHGDVSVEVPPSFDASSLRRLLSVVKEC